MRLLLVGDPRDLSLTYVGWLAQRRGFEVATLAEDRLGVDGWFRVDGRRTPPRADFQLGGDQLLAADDLAGAFVRLHPEPAVPPELELDEAAAPILIQERRAGLQHLLRALPCPVVNRPAAGRSNGSKPFQMMRLAAAGFAVPEWLATNDPGRASAFLRDCPDGAVVKSCSGLRSHVRRAGDDLIANLRQGTAPVLLQRYVGGGEVRIHTVGEKAFATRIRCGALDYRFDGEEVAFEAAEAPAALAERCRRFAAAEGLLLAGFDFRVEPSGQWWCLEVNPVPTFLPYEAGAGHPIGDAVLDLMATEPSRVEVSPLAVALAPS
jgi:glutathione synthase/RimK-type ligase-like ATP-grasp enzyme